MILDEIAAAARTRIEKLKRERPAPELKEQALQMPKGDFSFARALRASEFAMICEVKRASPSAGIISPEFPYLNIARAYEEAGADAISVLTEPDFFQGRDAYLREIRNAVKTPLLRKEFILDEYQIYESKCLGADAVLLICALLDDEDLIRFVSLCRALGLSTLVEAHTEEEVFRALSAGAEILGVNNRDLKTFQVDFNISLRLRPLAPEEILFIAESGVKTPEDIGRLARAGVNGALVGERLMRSGDPKAALALLREGTAYNED
ncbi:MAG: indole-3-glycerol phosphate synthase TrpC [Oscillospiraceae bacterium]|nr:indole-3-glycerol phosphate synthase TrpC [Oscillospiraceae bacterium]